MNRIRVTAVVLFYSIHLTHWEWQPQSQASSPPPRPTILQWAARKAQEQHRRHGD